MDDKERHLHSVKDSGKDDPVPVSREPRQSQNERRYHTPPPDTELAAFCRTCWAHVVLRADRVEIADGRPYYRCQSCEASFLIRWEDAAALGVTSTG